MAEYTMPDNVQKRLRYFDGQFLRDQDFIDEQNYHLDRQQRHNRLLHSPGIVSGLEITVKPETGEVTIAPGTALDSAGRQIVLSKETKQNLESTVAGQAMLVYIAFAQESADLAQTGSAEFTRWLEQPLIEIVREETPPKGRDPVVLARLVIGQDGKVTQVDNTDRVYAGVRLPGGSTLATNSTGQAQFGGPLQIATTGEALVIKPKAMKANDVAKLVFADPDNSTGPMSIEYKDSGSPGLAIMGGNLGVGTRDPGMRLSVSSTNNHAQLRREKTETAGGKQLLLELYQDDPANAVPEFYPSIRFHHNNKYWKRIEARSNGLHLKDGDLNNDTYIRLFAGGLTVSAAGTHTQLRREKTETTGDKQLFLELYQDDDTSTPKVPEVYLSLRFQHSGRYWHRIEARSDGFHFKDGALASEGYRALFTGNLTTNGNLAVKGNSALTGTLAVSAAGSHTQLRREKTETTGGKQLFLELYQDDDTTPQVPEVYPSIRFHHINRYWQRIEGRSDGFHFKEGNLSADGYKALFTGNLTTNGTLTTNGNLAVKGNSTLTGTLAVSASGSHAQLRREKTETTGGKQVFLELYQDDDATTKVPAVHSCIRFHHATKYWHRIEARSDGLHLKTGDLNLDDHINFFAYDITVNDITARDIKLSGKIDAVGHLSGSDVYFSENGQISSMDNNHRILFRRSEDKLELREYGQIIFSPGATQGKETAKIVFTSEGRVGIGTTSPRVPLEIEGSVNQTVSAYRYLSGGGTGEATNQTVPYSIRTSNRILATEFNANSDERIKHIQGRSDGAADLDTLLRLQITDFHYKDVIGQGNAPHKRVIGQQVEKVFPQAVSQHTDVVPDIYQPAALKEGWVALATDLKKGERVKLIPEQGVAGVYEVLEVTPDKFRTDFQPEGDQVFVFGREVNDFRVVDYDALAMLNVSATQQIKKELDVEVKSRHAESAELKARLEALEQEILARV